MKTRLPASKEKKKEKQVVPALCASPGSLAGLNLSKTGWQLVLMIQWGGRRECKASPH